jgi:hypothetical protein
MLKVLQTKARLAVPRATLETMSRLPRVAAAALVATALAACGNVEQTPPRVAEIAATATPSPAVPPTEAAPPAPPPLRPPPPAPVWVVGASPLPLRPDGFGEILPTPDVLRDRRLPTADVLTPPPDGAFASSIAPVTAEIRDRMGESWSPACPVALDDLRYLTLSFVGFDGEPHTGELVVAATVAEDVVGVFRTLFAQRFPIEEMRLPTTADLQAHPTGDGNNTAAYVCRAARGQKTWSQHAYGTAVDINPFHNPLVKRDLVVPELASAYADRADARPGMHLAGGPAVRAFEAIGWTWGGTWRSSKDYMHFSQNGR